MNQDDSIVTPTKDYAGKNAFAVGDYKYAANLRIGSSRKDNCNDGENIKDTLLKDTYWARAVVNTNPGFTAGALTGWSQLSVSGGTAWGTVGADVFCSAAAGSQLSNILYQAIAPHGKRMGFWIKMGVSYFNQSSYCRLIFLNGSTVISSQDVFSAGPNSTVTDFNFEKYINAEIPVGCTHVGVQTYFTSFVGGYAQIQGFKFFDWQLSARPSGTERVIGRKEDKENNLLYYCVYNSSGNHSLRFYDPIEDKIYTILQWSGLNFASTYFESMAIIDNYIGVTDRNNSPRLFDVWTTPDLYLILGSSDFREYHISFHKWAPIQPPTARGYYDGVTHNGDKFLGKCLQFSYNYVFYGNLRTRYSPVSNAVEASDYADTSGRRITSIELSIPGFTLDSPGTATQYNYFNNSNSKFYSAVKQIEIVYREGVNDVWKIWKRYDVRTSNNDLFYFDGDADNTPVSEKEFNQIFDAVPFKAGVIEAIDNRFVFADILDEKPVAPPVLVESIGTELWQLPEASTTYWNRGTSDAATNASFFSGMSAGDADLLGRRNFATRLTWKNRGLYKLGIQWIADNGFRSAVYTADNWIYEIPDQQGSVDSLAALEFKFPSTFRPPVWAVAYQIVRTNCLNIDYFLFGPCNQIRALIDDNTGFNDELQTPQQIRDRTRQHFEDAREVAGKDLKAYLNILRNKNYYKSLVADVRKTALAGTIADASRLYINITNWYNSSNKSAGTDNNPLNNLYYNYREGKQVKLGDRVRFTASTNATPTDADKVVYDMPILEFSGRGIIVEKPEGALWFPGNNAQTDSKDMMIEVYSPVTPDDANYLYHETGEWYPVLYPGTDQRDLSKRDWTYTNNAAVTCDTYGDFKSFRNFPFAFGDCHTVFKSYYFDYQAVTGATFISIDISSMVPDQDRMFDIWEYANGRSYPAYRELPIERFSPTKMRFGGQIIEESFVNNINRFRDEDQKTFPSEYGRIRGLVNTANAQVESVGAILLAIGERETFSIYVNRQTLEDLSGRTQVALSDKVLGSYNVLLGSFGTVNPESITLERGRVYYWDATDGSWVQYGRDGLTAVSGYKMKTWFREIAALLTNAYATSTPPIAVCEYDPYTEELYTFINHSGLPSTFRDYPIYKGVVLNDDSNRWVYCHSYEPEMFGRVNTQLISFVAGAPYLHEKGAGYSTFYGSKKDVYIEPVATSEKMEVWQNISVISTHGWSVERFLSEYRGAAAKRQSSLSLTQMTYEEDQYNSAILNDANTLNATNPVVTGDSMRSKALRALLKLDPSVVTESLLHYVNIHSIDSPKNS